MRRNTVRPRGEKIRQARDNEGWTQEELADKAECSKRTIENVENGKPCHRPTLGRIAKALGEEVEELLSNDEGALRDGIEPADESEQEGLQVDVITGKASTENGELCGNSPDQEARQYGGEATYKDTKTAISELATSMPDVEEAAFVVYVSKMFAEDLRALASVWRIKRLHLLLRDLDAIDPKRSGEIPREAKAIRKRRTEQPDVIRDIESVLGQENGEPVEIRYYRSQPCLRGLLLRERGSRVYSAGFLSIYRERRPKGNPVDYSSRGSPILRLSRDNACREALLDSFAAWFSFVWREGSYRKVASGRGV